MKPLLIFLALCLPFLLVAQLESPPLPPNTSTGSSSLPSTTTPLAPTWKSETTIIWYGVTGEIDLPAHTGYSNRGIIIYNTGAFTITLDPPGLTAMVRDGVVQSDGLSIILSAGAGNYVALVSDGSRWVTLGYKGILTQGS